MGLNYRYAFALLILLLPLSATSAVRTKVSVSSSDTIKNPISTQLSADFQTPNGAIHYYGRDKVYALDQSVNASAGSSIGPTVRPVNTSTTLPGGTTSFPNGVGAYTGNSSHNVQLKVKPKVVVPKAKPYAKLKNLVKANPAQIALSAATAAAVAGVGWVMSDENTKVQKKVSEGSPVPASTYGYSFSSTGCVGPWNSAESFMSCYQAYSDSVDGRWNWPYTVSAGANGSIVISYQKRYKSSGALVNTGSFTGNKVGNCSPPLVLTAMYTCVDPAGAVFSDITDSDLSALDPWLNQQSAEWLSGLIREQCNGSSSPDACYDDMRDYSQDTLEGPSSIAGPSKTVTSTYTKPDATTGTSQQVTNTRYDITYSPTYFDIKTTNTTTTTTDGLVTETTTEEDTTTPQEGTEEEQEPEYTFADSQLPEVTPFYEQKYPDGFQGVWDSAKSDFENSDFVSFLNSFVPNLSGTCPTWSMSFAIGNFANYGTKSFADLCYVFAFVKVCMMLGAVYFSRAVIFGG